MRSSNWLRSALNRSWILSTAFIGMAMLTQPAQAGLLLEPYIGYEVGTLEADYTSGGGTLKYDTSGVTFGARVGYTFPAMFWVGLDYSISSGDADVDSDPGNNYQSDTGQRSSLFAVVGIDLPILLRVYAGYGFMNEFKIDDSASSTYTGSAVKVGLGFTSLPFVSLNAEYIMSTYDTFEANGVERDIGSAPFSDAKQNALMLSASVPFDL